MLSELRQIAQLFSDTVHYEQANLIGLALLKTNCT